MTVKFSMTINGKPVEGETEDRTLLVQYIREHLRLTGTHVGCGYVQTGADKATLVKFLGETSRDALQFVLTVFPWVNL